MTQIIDNLLGMFKFYRKKAKGTWYRISETDSAGGIESPFVYWTRKPDGDDIEIIKTEEW
jgi:hypothetical protein